MLSRRKTILILACLFLLALGLNLAVSFKIGIAKPMQSDSMHFLLIAKSLSEGKGYYDVETFWPDQPAMGRMPGWPFAVSLALRLFPGSNPDLVMRLLCLLINAGIALLVALLTFRLLASLAKGVIAGLLFAVHPTALYLAYEGLSEIFFIFLILAGALCLIGQWTVARARREASSVGIHPAHGVKSWLLPVLGFILMGYACIIRANLIIWVGFFFLLWLVYSRLAGQGLRFPLFLLCSFLFLIPSGIWMARNHAVCGHFPVISTLKGEVMYGGSNPVTAYTWEFWGYWVFPDNIPGETTKRELAGTMNEYELDRYYSNKARAFIKENLAAMPILVLGRLVRAYLPIPWKPKLGSLCVSLYRWLLYVSAGIGAWMFWRRIDRSFMLVFAALLCVNVATVVMFWGCARFAFDMEPFLLVFAVSAWGLVPRLKHIGN